MMNIRKALIDDISAGIENAITAGDLQEHAGKMPVTVKQAEGTGHGDYASPIALAIGKQAKKNPLDIVEVIVRHMPKKEYVEMIEAAKPGFLNITISTEYLASRMDDISHEDICEACNIGNEKAINMEFISANPTGPLTLGNARTAFSADTLANVFACAGYNVTREYYINDAGEQIRRLGESVLRRIIQQEGHKVEFPEDLYQGEYISDMAKDIAEEFAETEKKKFDKTDLENEELLARISTLAMERCLLAIKQTISDDLKISFDVFSSERAVRDSGEIENVLTKLRKKELTFKKEGAEFLQTTKFGDDKDRVIVKKDGSYAYITPDIAYHQDKFDRKYDMIFTFLGADHQGHIPKLKAALSALGNDVEKLRMMVAQFLAITQGGKPVKLSKRKGNVYGPKDLIEEIGYDAARFFMVQHALQHHMVLDLEVAKEKSEANPVYYVQYSYVRLQSILRKAKEMGIAIDGDAEISEKVSLTNDSERALALALHKFPEIVEDVAQSYAVHQLAFFAYDLARAINVFYRDVPILAEEDETLRLSRLQIALSARFVLSKTLDLLGISKPDVM
ncbi:MAG: arginine--tRNA ligase [Candidatus Andersenbacteria bacterium]|nr:arginine--tRNA ligase [Candidatus Andersenbacteria bacterium]